MGILAKLRVWLVWLVAVPLLLWTISGIVIATQPMAQVHGERLRKSIDVRPIPAGWLASQLIEGADRPIELRTRMQGNSAVTSAIYADGKVERYFARSGAAVPRIDAAAARTIVAMEIEGGDRIKSVRYFAADKPSFELRRAIPVWQVTLQDGTRVYVGQDSGDIEAIHARWWSLFDTIRGLHTMEPGALEAMNNPVLVLLASVGLLMTVIGAVLLFRRSPKDKAGAPAPRIEASPQ